jgi:hypothetical protein
MFMWLQPSPWPTLRLCSAEGHPRRLYLTGAFVEVPSRIRKYRLFQQRDDGFVSVGSCVGDHAGAFSVSGEPSFDRSPSPRPAQW